MSSNRLADDAGSASSVLDSARRKVVLTSVGIAVTAPLILAAARWPRWWSDIAPEQTPMTWLQSVVLVVAAVAAALTSTADRLRGSQHHRRWLILTAGFLILAVDERFAIHERLRDGLLAPRGISAPFLPWVAPGDFLILGGAAIGLALLPKIIALMQTDPAARRALILGVALAAVAVGSDSIDPATWTLAQERVQQSLEECVELASGLSLMTAILLRLLTLMHPEPVSSTDTSSEINSTSVRAGI